MFKLFNFHSLRIWQRRYWEHTIRNNDDLNRHIDYIHINPVKHGWVKRVADWPYSSFHRYVRQGLLQVRLKVRFSVSVGAALAAIIAAKAAPTVKTIALNAVKNLTFIDINGVIHEKTIRLFSGRRFINRRRANSRSRQANCLWQG